MGANKYKTVVDQSVHEIGRILIIKDTRPDWFVTPSNRKSFTVLKNTKLILVEGSYRETVTAYSSGPKSKSLQTELLTVEHTLLIRAGTVAQVLPDSSFFFSNVIIKRAGIKRGVMGQATFYPPKPAGTKSPPHCRPRPPYAVAIRSYAGNH